MGVPSRDMQPRERGFNRKYLKQFSYFSWCCHVKFKTRKMENYK
jgi:hypothetical protein